MVTKIQELKLTCNSYHFNYVFNFLCVKTRKKVNCTNLYITRWINSQVGNARFYKERETHYSNNSFVPVVSGRNRFE